VYGTFRHIAKALLTLHVEGLEAPIQCIPRHPFWSVDRHDFVEAGDLKPHERLLSNTGETVQVLATSIASTSVPVYNIEVDTDHVYRVTELGLLVHNASKGNGGNLEPGDIGAPTTKNPLKVGVDFEAQKLAELGLPKNNTVWRPTVEQTQSSAFKVIVGDSKYTRGRMLKGTTLDATEGGLLEIKHGSSVLHSSYQLRLQTFRSLTEGTPYTIHTTRPINPTFRDWLQRWGVKAERIE
jgi:hypothetical protein